MLNVLIALSFSSSDEYLFGIGYLVLAFGVVEAIDVELVEAIVHDYGV